MSPLKIRLAIGLALILSLAALAGCQRTGPELRTETAGELRGSSPVPAAPSVVLGEAMPPSEPVPSEQAAQPSAEQQPASAAVKVEY